jgi:hypothetical protein
MDSKSFLAELLALFEKHGKAIVPTFENEVSFHDRMCVVDLDDDTRDYLTRIEIKE